MKILLNGKIEKNRKIIFAKVSEHCASFGTKNSTSPLLEEVGCIVFSMKYPIISFSA